MTKVQLQAGINEEHLTLALEAEAASIYLQSDLSRNDPDSPKQLLTEMPYVVVDLGGKINYATYSGHHQRISILMYM